MIQCVLIMLCFNYFVWNDNLFLCVLLWIRKYSYNLLWWRQRQKNNCLFPKVTFLPQRFSKRRKRQASFCVGRWITCNHLGYRGESGSSYAKIRVNRWGRGRRQEKAWGHLSRPVRWSFAGSRKEIREGNSCWCRITKSLTRNFIFRWRGK